MPGDNQGGHRPLNQTRDVTIEALCEHFANDAMSVEEFERRVEVAHQAETVEEIKALLRDLPGGDVPMVPTAKVPAPAPKQEFGVTAAAHVKDQAFVVACLGGATRKGRWTPARKNYAIAVMGGTELDFREAIFGPGITELQVFAIMGGVEIIVPPGLTVESHGVAIMGGFDHLADTTQPDSMEGPVLRISGVACMGGVDVTVRHPGETAREARRRRKLERKERRRLGGGR
jgi:hypothetical protein